MHEPQPYMLLIDDDEEDLEMFSSELQKQGIPVKSFESSAKALFYLTLVSDNKELPSLIIMDYNMPKRNGYQVLRLIKENNETKNIPVVMYSTSMSAVLKAQLKSAGALGCFDKPWNYSDLKIQVEKFQELAFSINQ